MVELHVAMSSHTLLTFDSTTPGKLDQSQPLQILRHVNSQLFFISYDLLMASKRGNPTVDNIMFNRIVVEVQPNGIMTWKLVPHATQALGVTDKGKWPQVIDICR